VRTAFSAPATHGILRTARLVAPGDETTEFLRLASDVATTVGKKATWDDPVAIARSLAEGAARASERLF